jgi:hypothetical protein
MKAVFYTRTEIGRVAESDYRETNLAEDLKAGGKKHGIDVEIRIAESAFEPELVDCDLVCLAGVKSRHWFTAYAKRGIPWLYFDKGYIRERAAINWLEYWRFAVNAHHPITFLEHATRDRARADSMGFRFKPWVRVRGQYIVVDGGSEKNFKFNGIVPEEATIEDVDEHCELLAHEISLAAPGYQILYRPKPSSKGRKAIAGAVFSRDRADYDKKSPTNEIARAHAVVTYNGAICYDAHTLGIPSVVLGSGPARPISSTTIEEILEPRLATDAERRQWLNNLAWCQFKPAEIRNGDAWPTILEMMKLAPIQTPAEACPCSPL